MAHNVYFHELRYPKKEVRQWMEPKGCWFFLGAISPILATPMQEFLAEVVV